MQANTVRRRSAYATISALPTSAKEPFSDVGKKQCPPKPQAEQYEDQ
jgi:hypothetical protein